MSLMAGSLGRGFAGVGEVFGRAGPLAGALVILPALALLATGCSGGQAGPGVAQASSSPSARASTKGVAAFAACMRSHGVPNFPDSGSIDLGNLGIDPNSQQFQDGMTACRSLLPQSNGGRIPVADQEAFLKFSACMRAHGVPNFPDPDFSQGGAKLHTSADLDPSSPQFQAAQKACQSLLPGGLIKARRVGPGGAA